ncbi:MAG: Oligoketide cyclase/lipid transport protein [Gammaproteobacteria bacterium]|jgi:ribosome-associated toxin RatA of RatAB toxin-antitoxin module|nr:Oligoketide cyclase/lipid transport protein [Gammaproteobacteria bacterium]
MPHIYREKSVPYSAKQMYELVNNVEDYPKFLPFCKNAVVSKRNSNSLTATLLLAKGGIHKTFTTKNTLTPYERIDIDLVNGPFKHLTGHWKFVEKPNGCLVCIDLEFEFSSIILEMLFGPVFNEMVHTLINSFTKEAKKRFAKS